MERMVQGHAEGWPCGIPSCKWGGGHPGNSALKQQGPRGSLAAAYVAFDVEDLRDAVEEMPVIGGGAVREKGAQ